MREMEEVGAADGILQLSLLNRSFLVKISNGSHILQKQVILIPAIFLQTCLLYQASLNNTFFAEVLLL